MGKNIGDNGGSIEVTKDFGVAKLDGGSTFSAGACSCGSGADVGNACGGGSGQYGSGGEAAESTIGGATTRARHGSPDDHARAAAEFYRHGCGATPR